MALNLENQSETKLDWLKWIIVSVLLVAGLWANYYYTQQPWPLRLLAGLFLFAIIAATIFQTSLGRRAYVFARESRMELRKVVWPTRQETIHTTFIIAVLVIILALMLWGVDGMLVWLMGWLTGQRG
jgi:preprotein translocase subunit SecE